MGLFSAEFQEEYERVGVCGGGAQGAQRRKKTTTTGCVLEGQRLSRAPFLFADLILWNFKAIRICSIRVASASLLFSWDSGKAGTRISTSTIGVFFLFFFYKQASLIGN